MLIRCAVCKKLFFFDDTPRDTCCPACGSANTYSIAMSIVFGRTPGDAEWPSPPQNPLQSAAPKG